MPTSSAINAWVNAHVSHKYGGPRLVCAGARHQYLDDMASLQRRSSITSDALNLHWWRGTLERLSFSIAAQAVRPASGSGCRVTRRSASRLTNKTASTKKPRLARRKIAVPVAVISLTIKPWASAPESHSKSVEPICGAGNHLPASTLERVLKVRQAIPAVNAGGRMSATPEHVSLRLTDSGKQCSWQCRRARSSRAAEEQSSVSVRTSFVIVRVVTSLRCSPP
jgi:hypothetical protein